MKIWRSSGGYDFKFARLDTSILQSKISSYNCLPSTSELYAAPKFSHIDYSFSQSGPIPNPWRSIRKTNLDRKSLL